MPRGVTTAPADPAMQGARGPREPKQAARKCFHYCLILLPNYRYLRECNAIAQQEHIKPNLNVCLAAVAAGSGQAHMPLGASKEGATIGVQ